MSPDDQETPRRRVRLSLPVGACLIVALLAVLVTPLCLPGLKYSQVPVAGEAPGKEAVAMDGAVGPDGTLRATIDIEVTSAVPPNEVEAVEVLFGTYRAQPVLQEATLESVSGRCRMRAGSWQTLEDNRLLRFTPAPRCELSSGEHLRLSVTAKRASGLALFGAKIDPTPDALAKGILAVVGPGGAGMFRPVAYIEAAFAGHVDEVPRFDLLAAMWGQDPGSRLWLGSRLGVALLIVLLGAGLLVVATGRLTGWRHALLVALGSGLLFAGLGLYDATITPPFEAPDEATHYLTYRDLTGQPSADAEALALAQRGNYARMMCRTDQCFAAEDALAHADHTPWPGHVGRTNMPQRSALGTELWSLYGSWFKGLDVPTGLWCLRAANALMLGLAIALGLLFTQTSAGSRASMPRFLALAAILLPPSLPNFGMHVSNHALTLAGYFVAVIVGLNMLLAGRGLAKSLLMGAALAVMALSGRVGAIGALAIAGLTLLLALTDLALQPSGARVRRAIVQGLHAAVMAAAFMVAAYPLRKGPYIAGIIWQANNRFGIWWEHRPSMGILAALALALVAAPVGIVAASKRWTFYRSPQAVSLLGGVFAATILAVAVLPFFHTVGPIPALEQQPWDHAVSGYVRHVLRSFVGNSGLGGQDFFLFWSFWGGFGCPDRTLPDVVVQGFKAFVLCGWFAFGIACVWSRRREFLLQIASFVAIGFTWLCFLAFTTATEGPGMNFHGRYSIGFHLLNITGCLLGFRALWEALAESTNRAAPPRAGAAGLLALLALVVLSQGLGAWWHLARFFQ